jgi:rod shape determining protein RodA
VTIQKTKKTKKTFKIDITLTIILLAMAAFSIIAIQGAIPLTSSTVNGQDILVKQIIWFILGFSLLAGLLFFGIDRLFTGVRVFYWILMFLLLLLFLDRFIDLPFIRPLNGTRAWIILPGIGTLQPSEFMKIVLIIMTANVVDAHNRNRTIISFKTDMLLFLNVAKYVLPPLLLIILQPDTGIPIVIIFTIIAILAVSGIKHQWIWAGLLVIVVGLGGAIYLYRTSPETLASILGNSYRLNRFHGWLATDRYIYSWGNQLYTALLAVGSAGWTGHGKEAVLITLLEPQNDFIFAVIGKNYGFLGTATVLIVNLLLDLKLLSIALAYEHPRERYMVAGLLGMLLFQQFQNMGMIVGLLPITGITLPMISAGGSSLLSYMIPFAIVYHMSNENKNKTLH